jgi:nucleoid-associated protein YgaU
VNIAPAPPVRSNPAPPVGPAPPPPSVNATTRKHTVASGDTLSKIAQQYYGDRSKFQQIFEANRDVMSDPNRLPKVGTELKIP